MAMQHTIRAFVRSAVHYGAGASRALAPRGEYEIEPRGNCVGLCACGADCVFTLSFDAFQQHVVEGRIAIRS